MKLFTNNALMCSSSVRQSKWPLCISTVLLEWLYNDIGIYSSKINIGHFDCLTELLHIRAVCAFSLHQLARAACMRCHGTKCSLLTAFLFSSLSHIYFSPRRGYRRVLQFCMEF